MLINPDTKTTKEKQRIIIETQSLKDLQSKIQNTIQKNEWLSIYGESGTGKSTSIAHLVESYPETQYIKIHYEGILLCYKDVTNSIMSECINKMLPGESPVRDIFARYTQFKRALVEGRQEGKKIILLINEAHRLTQETMYGIKMLHEAGQNFYEEHLFPIIMSGQLNLRRKVVAHELNFRIKRYQMKLLNEQEVKSILNANGYTCNDSVLNSIVLNSLQTPNGVYHYIDQIKEELGIASGNLDINQLYEIPGFSIKNRMEKYGMSLQETAEVAKEITGLDYSTSTISKISNGKLTVGPKPDALITHWQEIEQRFLNQEKAEPKVEHNMA